jgi:hypothetical protein
MSVSGRLASVSELVSEGTGPKTGERMLELRWLPPIPVRYNEVDGPVVIHKVHRD